MTTDFWKAYLTIVSTKECYSRINCPSEYVRLEDKYYEKDKCPKDDNTKYDGIAQKCVWDYKWYKKSRKRKISSKR